MSINSPFLIRLEQYVFSVASTYIAKASSIDQERLLELVQTVNKPKNPRFVFSSLKILKIYTRKS